jgi:hypothetical protein
MNTAFVQMSIPKLRPVSLSDIDEPEDTIVSGGIPVYD